MPSDTDSKQRRGEIPAAVWIVQGCYENGFFWYLRNFGYKSSRNLWPLHCRRRHFTEALYTYFYELISPIFPDSVLWRRRFCLCKGGNNGESVGIEIARHLNSTFVAFLMMMTTTTSMVGQCMNAVSLPVGSAIFQLSLSLCSELDLRHGVLFSWISGVILWQILIIFTLKCIFLS